MPVGTAWERKSVRSNVLTSGYACRDGIPGKDKMEMTMKITGTGMRIPAQLFVLLTVVLIGASCASGPQQAADRRPGEAPLWMLDLQSTYPEDQFVAAVEFGSSERDARNLATGALARRFNLNVESNVEVQERIQQITRESEFYAQEETDSLKTVNTSTGNIEFANLEFSDTFTDPRGRVHVVAYLNRSETGQIYRKRIQKDARLIRSLVQRSQNADTNLIRFALLDTALTISRNGDQLVSLLEIIHPGMAAIAAAELNSPVLLELRDDAAGEIAYRISIAGDEDGKLESTAASVLSDFGIYPSPGGSLVFTISVLSEEVEVNPQFKSLRWTLSANLADDNGVSIVNLHKESRENAISISEAKAFSLVAIEKSLAREFGGKFTAWIDSISLGL